MKKKLTNHCTLPESKRPEVTKNPHYVLFPEVSRKRYQLFFLFIQKNIYNGHINKMKKTKTKIHITVIRCNATVTPEIKLKEEQQQK